MGDIQYASNLCMAGADHQIGSIPDMKEVSDTERPGHADILPARGIGDDPAEPGLVAAATPLGIVDLRKTQAAKPKPLLLRRPAKDLFREALGQAVGC